MTNGQEERVETTCTRCRRRLRVPAGCRLVVTALVLLTAAALHVSAFKPPQRNHPRHKLMTSSSDQHQRHVPGRCRKAASQWSGCSKSCGIGVSTRVVMTPVPVLDAAAADPDAALASNEFEDGGATEEGATGCRVKREVRLCYLRPCDDLQRYQPAVSSNPVSSHFFFTSRRRRSALTQRPESRQAVSLFFYRPRQ